MYYIQLKQCSHSPASLDFDQADSLGPSVDIIMGDITHNDAMIPNILITTALSNKEKHRLTTRDHGFLHAPIVFLPAELFFQTYKTVEFGLSKDPMKVVKILAHQTRLLPFYKF